MKRRVLILSGFFMVLLCSGCATTRSSLVALENRVQVLETKVEDLSIRKNMTACLVPDLKASDGLAAGETDSISVSAANMTKEQIQLALKNVGYYNGKIDGKLGSQSQAAIKEFQKDMGLKIDGVAGRKTKEKLVKYLEGR